MVDVILGGLLGLCVGSLIFCICWGASINAYKYDGFLFTLGVVLSVACTIIGCVGGYSIGHHQQEAFVETYAITKDTIERSITNENLGGLERVELVKQAVEINHDLVKRQYDSKQWYGFLIPDEILELEPIRLGDS